MGSVYVIIKIRTSLDSIRVLEKYGFTYYGNIDKIYMYSKKIPDILSEVRMSALKELINYV